MDICTLLLYMPHKFANAYVRFLLKKEGQGKSTIARKYFKKRYKVDVGLYSYGGCFDPNFNTGGEVSLGRYCSIANDVHYFGANHPVSYVSTSAYFYNKSLGYEVKDVQRETLEIGNDVWIGYGTIILSGCHKIGNGCVIGAGSIVTHDIPPYAIAVGNPAKIIKYRFTLQEQEKLEKSRWWDQPPEEIMRYYDHIDNLDLFLKEFIKKA